MKNCTKLFGKGRYSRYAKILSGEKMRLHPLNIKSSAYDHNCTLCFMLCHSPTIGTYIRDGKMLILSDILTTRYTSSKCRKRTNPTVLSSRLLYEYDIFVTNSDDFATVFTLCRIRPHIICLSHHYSVPMLRRGDAVYGIIKFQLSK